MWVAFVELCIYNGRLDRASKFMKLFFTDMMIISGININDYKEIDSDYYEYPWVENGEANVQIYKRLIRLDERNFLRGLEQGWGGVGLRTDFEKKNPYYVCMWCSRGLKENRFHYQIYQHFI